MEALETNVTRKREKVARAVDHPEARCNLHPFYSRCYLRTSNSNGSLASGTCPESERKRRGTKNLGESFLTACNCPVFTDSNWVKLYRRGKEIHFELFQLEI